MIKTITALVLNRFHILIWITLAILAVATSIKTMEWLGGYYSASAFPVSVPKGQLTFNAQTTKGYYQTLLDLGTLDKYLLTQKLDFLLMVTFLVSMFLLGAAATRLINWQFKDSKLTKFSLGIMWITPIAALFDALENMVSFVMLSNPTHFSDWLIWPYSTFAAAKFSLITLGYVWAIIAVILTSLTFILRCLPKQIRAGRNS
ncbi:MAG: hypothetical protein ABJN69_03245 [Hellea sp.]